MINKVILMGHVGAEPEVKSVNDGKVANFPIATNESYKLPDGTWKDITEWHQIEAWKRVAEKAEKQIQKGSLVYLEGKIKKNVWEDQNGQKHSNTRIVALDLKVIDKRKDAENSSNYTQGNESNTKLDVDGGQVHSNVASEPDGADDLPF